MSGKNDTEKQKKNATARRKRVNRFKGFIIGVAVLLLFLSVILNFILAVKVLRLEDKIDHLYSNNYSVTYDIEV